MADFQQTTPTPPAMLAQVPDTGPAPGVKYDLKALMAWHQNPANLQKQKSLTAQPGMQTMDLTKLMQPPAPANPLPAPGAPGAGVPGAAPGSLPPLPQLSTSSFSVPPAMPSPFPTGANNLAALLSPMQTSQAPPQFADSVTQYGNNLNGQRSVFAPGASTGASYSANPAFDPTGGPTANAVRSFMTSAPAMMQAHAALQTAQTEAGKVAYAQSPLGMRQAILGQYASNPQATAAGMEGLKGLVGQAFEGAGGGQAGGGQAGGGGVSPGAGTPQLNALTRMAKLNSQLAVTLEGMNKNGEGDPATMMARIHDVLGPAGVEANKQLIRDYFQENLKGGSNAVSAQVRPNFLTALANVPSVVSGLIPGPANWYTGAGREELQRQMRIPAGERYDKAFSSTPTDRTVGHPLLRSLGF